MRNYHFPSIYTVISRLLDNLDIIAYTRASNFVKNFQQECIHGPFPVRYSSSINFHS